MEAHQHAISVVKQVLRAAQEAMDSDRARAKGELPAAQCFCIKLLEMCVCGEGGSSLLLGEGEGGFPVFRGG